MRTKYIIILSVLIVVVVLGLVIFIPSKHKAVTREKEEIKKPVVAKEEVKVEEEKEVKEKKLEKMEPKAEVWEEIRGKIATGNPYRKQEAIAELVKMGDGASIKQIEELTHDRTPSVINRALGALGELKSEASIPVIEEVMETNRVREDGYGESIRIYGVNALGDIGSEKSVDMLGTELSKRNILFGTYVVDAMNKIGSEKSLPYLEEYKTFLSEQLANMPGAEEIGEYRYVWEQADKQVKEAIDKIKVGL